MIPMTRRRDRSRGQALAEFAMVIPIFLLLLFAIVDVARYVYTQNALSNMAREAARVSAVESRPACAQAARDACANSIARTRITGVGLKAGVATSGSPSAVGVFVECRAQTSLALVSMSACRSNDILKVRLNSDFTLVTPLVSSFLSTLALTGEAQVTVN